MLLLKISGALKNFLQMAAGRQCYLLDSMGNNFWASRKNFFISVVAI
jgi:hypothetical protein